MGIDLEKAKRGRVKVTRRRRPRSRNVYMHLAHQLYTFLSRRTSSKFNREVARRLAMSNIHRPVVSLQKVAIFQQRNPGNTIVVVGPVTDDQRMVDLPKISLCALRVSEPARARILAAGGEILTLDQLAMRSPLGKKTTLIRGKQTVRKQYKVWKNGAPRVRNPSRKKEKGRFHGIVKRSKLRKKL